ncbi:hypothetical protein PIB30_100187 [Stylosanthes scabra]|uniref:GRF-type domain-containing protein n=1 Tax=Stylosanthes scabra TaxID=79078 RepID=A0ABU6XZG9_9FABA|nr:hypothetical protein [Stylosanthes scabra]
MKTPIRVSNLIDSDASSYGVGARRKLKRHPYNGERCYHGMDAMLLKFRTAENPNRWFLRCPHYKKSDLRCEYFIWVDEVCDLDTQKEVEEKNSSRHTSSW